MKISHRFEFIKARFDKLSLNQKVAALIVLFFMMFFCIKFIHFIMDLGHHYRKHHHIPMLIREEKTITVPEGSPLRKELHVQTLKTITKPHVFKVPGLIEANPETFVNLMAPTNGRLMALQVKLGDKVEQGQVLATLLSGDIAQALADKNKAEAALLVAEAALTRAMAVQKAGGNALKDVQMAQMNFDQAKAESMRAIARLKALGDASFHQLTIKAPISGQITQINYGVGGYINDLTVPILTLANINTVYVTAFVPENMVAQMAPAQEATIHLLAYPDKELKGQIKSVSALLDMDTRRNKVRFYFDNLEGHLLPNMFADIDILVPQPPSIMIPNSAIVMNNEKIITFVETSPWVFKPQEITLGLQDGHEVRVLKGLKAGDRVVVEGGVFIND